LTVCGNAFAQKGAASVYESENALRHRDRLVKEFKDRKKLVETKLLNHPAFRFYRAEGAFYLFPEINYRGMNSFDLADLLLTRAGVAVVPGEEFGPQYTKNIRIAYTCGEKPLIEGLERIEACFKC
jgi:aspartate/methionine/tyrosine aminotransferase